MCGFRVQGQGFSVWRFWGLRVCREGCEDLECVVQKLKCRLGWGFGVVVLGFGFRVSGSEFGVQGFGVVRSRPGLVLRIEGGRVFGFVSGV